MSTISASTTSTTAYKVTADTTGTLVFQTGATPTTAMTLGSDQSVTFAGAQTYTGGATFNSSISVQGITVGRGAGAVSTNTAVGASALAANTSGLANAGFGNSVLFNNTSGQQNTAVGHQAIYSNTTGGYNAALGTNALFANSTGAYNTAHGAYALYSNTTASNNTAVGYQAGYTNSTGANNVFVGRLAGYYSTGGQNTSVGEESGYYTTGTNNTYLGYGAGPQSSGSTGSYNTLLGNLSGYLITTGSKNSILGCYNGNQGGLDIRTASNYIVLSDGDGNPRAYCNGSGAWTFPGSAGSVTTDSGGNYLVFTRNSTNYIYASGGTSAVIQVVSNTNGVQLSNGATSWSAVSDERQKNIIEPISNAINKVATLRAVIGNYKSDDNNVRRSFLIAQDVQAVLPEAVSTIEQEDGNEVLGLSYTEVIPLLVAAIKELKAEVDSLKAQINGASA